MVMPGKPPATCGFVTMPGIVALRRRRPPERLLHRVGVACDQDKRNSFTTVGDKMRVQPADERVRLDRLVAERRGPSAVHDAAEGARDVALTIRVDVAARRRCRSASGAPVDAGQQAVGVVDQIRDWRKKLLAPAWFGQGTRARIAGRVGIDAARPGSCCPGRAGR